MVWWLVMDGVARVTVHMAEVENDAETDDVLGFRPDRLGERHREGTWP